MLAIYFNRFMLFYGNTLEVKKFTCIEKVSLDTI